MQPAALFIMLIMNVQSYHNPASIDYKLIEAFDGITMEQCFKMAEEINTAAPMVEGNVTAVCAPQPYIPLNLEP